MSSHSTGMIPNAASGSASSQILTASAGVHSTKDAHLDASPSTSEDASIKSDSAGDAFNQTSSAAYPSLSLAMAGHVLSTMDDPAATKSVLSSNGLSTTLSPPQLYSSPSLSSDTKHLAHPILSSPAHDANSSALPQSSNTSPALLGIDDPSPRHSGSASPSILSGASSPALSATNELQNYAQQIQHQLLRQHMHQQLDSGHSQVPSDSLPARSPLQPQFPSTTSSAYNSPPDSGRSSPNLYGSIRSHRAPHVLETNRLDIQTHTSGRRMVNQYLIESELGRGMHGKVRLATDLETGERVAVKIVEREARKRLGAGLGLLNRNKTNKDTLQLNPSTSSNKLTTQDAKEDQQSASEPDGSDTPRNEASSSASTTGKGVTNAPSTQFAPLPSVPRTPSATGLGFARWGQSDRDSERRREKEREKARKALLWTTDQKVRREIAIMKKCSHDNVVQLKEVIDDPQSKKIFMVLEYMEGGEVVWKDEQGRPMLTVDEARGILRDVVCGLEYLHYQGIIHRDIKPANLLWDKEHRVKISDFGVSHFSYAMMIANDRDAAAASVPDLKSDSQPGSTSDPSLIDDRELAKTAGSPAFFAPELCMSSFSSVSPSVDPTRGSHVGSLADAANGKVATSPIKPKITKAIDVWALGVTLYCLLFGTTPFTAESEYALFAVIPTADYSIPKFMGADRVWIGPRKPRWQSQSQWTDEEADAQPASPSELCPDATPESLTEDARQLRDLLDRLLEKDPAKRITLEDVKKHPWVTRGLQDAPAWLSETDPQHLPFVEISHADVEDALTGFSKLKQRVKRWQSKLIDSFGGGRRRSRSFHRSSAASSVQADAQTNSGTSTPHHTRLGGFDRGNSMPVTPAESSSQSRPSTASSLRTPRTPHKSHMFFSRQKSAGSVGRRDGTVGLRALTSVQAQDEADPLASDALTKGSSPQGLSAVRTSPPLQVDTVAERDQVTTLAPVLPPPVLIDGAEDNTMRPPESLMQRRASAQSSSSAGLRPDVGPEIPQRTSSDTHGAARRVSGTSASPSLHNPSPKMPMDHRMPDRQGSESCPQRAASPRRSVDSEGKASTLNISQASRVSGRHRLGDFLRGSWLMNAGDERNRSTSRPGTRDSHDAPPSSSSIISASRSQRSGSVRSTAGSFTPNARLAVSALGTLSVDTQGAVQQAGARPGSGTPTSAPVLGSNTGSVMSGAPNLSTELLTEPVGSPSMARTAFSALSTPSSPLAGSDGVPPFAFDQLGRRRHIAAPLEEDEFDNDDIDLELEFSDDDLSDDLHAAVHEDSGPAFVNSGHGWEALRGNPRGADGKGTDFVADAYGRKGSSGSASSNDILTPSVEGGYNVFKAPYQHILSPSEPSALPQASEQALATSASGEKPGVEASTSRVTDSLPHAAVEVAAPACQTFAMDATLSNEANALRKAEMTELGGSRADGSGAVAAEVTDDQATPVSSSSVSRSASHRQHGSDDSLRASSAAETHTTRSEFHSAALEDAEAKMAGHASAGPTVTAISATEESQFADAEEDTVPQTNLGTAVSKQNHLGLAPISVDEQDDESDDQAISFQARRKRSTPFRTPSASSAQ